MAGYCGSCNKHYSCSWQEHNEDCEEPIDINGFDFVDDNYQCDVCGLTDDHSLDCPNDNSPFGLLFKEGFD